MTNLSSRLKKASTTLIFTYDRFLMIAIKELIFSIFRYYWKSSAAYTKIIICVLFNVNMFQQIHYSLISPFSNDDLFKTGAHLRFKREILKDI